MTFTDDFTFTSMQLVSIFYMMLRFVGSLINTHDDDDDDDDDDKRYKPINIVPKHWNNFHLSSLKCLGI